MIMIVTLNMSEKIAMASSVISLLLLTLLHPIAASLHRRPPILRSHSLPESAAPPTTYFEVTKPIPLPKTQPLSFSILNQHEFAYTYNKPPVLTNYKPPSNPNNFSKIILEWNATSKGRQFDRIFGVWIGGAEVFRSCTAEPRATGIFWTVKKDITRYRSLLTTEQTVSVYMGNVVDTTYTGVYHVNLTFHFYPSEEHHHYSASAPASESAADLILPVSRNLPLNDGLWFEIENSTVLHGKSVKIPRNAYRAVLEVYVSFHEKDEFWFGNFPNEYLSLNNLTETPGNGPFREVVVHVDGVTVGAVWPFTVIFTGGVNPFLWRPITAIGSFDLPSYDIDITPFLGGLLDGKSSGHKFEFSVTNGLNVWYIDANLHLWLDDKMDKTRGALLKHSVSALSSSLVSKIYGSDGLFTTNASRGLVSKGWVESSHGLITTEFSQKFGFSNTMKLKKGGDMQVLNQTIKFNQNVIAKTPSSTIFSTTSRKKFRISLYYDSVEKGNRTTVNSNVTLGIEEKSGKVSDIGSASYRLKNVQKGDGYYVVEGKTIKGLGTTQQKYQYFGDGSCYYRKVRSSNYTILHDKESNTCKTLNS